MKPFMLGDLEAAIRSSWSAETATPPNKAHWQPENPAYDQCGVTALVLQDLLGGELVRGEVRVDGVRVDFHWWNRLASGIDIDLTRGQFVDGEVVVGAEVITRPADAEIRWCRAEYKLLRARVLRKLALDL